MLKRIFAKYSVWHPLIIGTLLRFLHLGGRSFWNDEGLTAYIVNRPLPEALHYIAEYTMDGYLYYLVLLFWGKLVGVTEFSLGFISAVAGIVTIYFAYRLLKIVASEKEAYICAFITALVPFMVYASNEVRPYSAFLGMTSVLTAYFFLRALQEDKIRYWILTTVFTVLNGYVHLLGWSLGLTMFFFILLSPQYRKWNYLWKTAVVLFIAVLIYLPQLIVAYQQLSQYGTFDGTTRSGQQLGFIRVLLLAVKQFLGGTYRLMTGYYFMDLGGAGFTKFSLANLALFIVTLLTGLGIPLAAALSLLKKKSPWILFFALMFLTAFIQVFWEGVDPRRLTPPAAALYALIALAYFDWKRSLRIIFISLFLISTVFSLGKMYSLTSSIARQEDFRRISEIITAERAPGDIVLYYGGPASACAWEFYDPGNTIITPSDSHLSPDIYFRPSLGFIFDHSNFTTGIDSLLPLHTQVWLLFANYPKEEIKSGIASFQTLYGLDLVFEDGYNLLYKLKNPAAENSPSNDNP